MTNAGTFADFPGNSVSFKYKQKRTSSTEDDGRKNVKIMVPVKYLSNFWRTLEMSLTNCEINVNHSNILILTELCHI